MTAHQLITGGLVTMLHVNFCVYSILLISLLSFLTSDGRKAIGVVMNLWVGKDSNIQALTG